MTFKSRRGEKLNERLKKRDPVRVSFFDTNGYAFVEPLIEPSVGVPSVVG